MVQAGASITGQSENLLLSGGSHVGSGRRVLLPENVFPDLSLAPFSKFCLKQSQSMRKCFFIHDAVEVLEYER